MKRFPGRSTREDRRHFFLSSAAVGAAATVLPAAMVRDAEADGGSERAHDTATQARGYRVTPHVATYYRTAAL